MDVSVRGVEEDAFIEFRAKAVSRGLKTGKALSEAMKEWAGKNETRQKKKSFFDMKPFNGGNADLSSNVDKYLYGGKA